MSVLLVAVVAVVVAVVAAVVDTGSLLSSHCTFPIPHSGSYIPTHTFQLTLTMIHTSIYHSRVESSSPQ